MKKTIALILLITFFIFIYGKVGLDKLEKKNTTIAMNSITKISTISKNSEVDKKGEEREPSVISVKSNAVDKITTKDEGLLFKQDDLGNLDLNKMKRRKRKFKELTLIDKIEEHKVEKGETLWNIARDHNIDIDTLIGANDINNMNRIRPGDTLKILPVKGILYRIGPGENLSSIAEKFGLKLATIIKDNNIKNPNNIQPGQLLILTGAKPDFGYKDRLENLFIKPIESRISSYFGRRWGRMHEGLDFAAQRGTNVMAAGRGRVVYRGWVRGYGKTIIIEHQKGIRTLYGHNSKLLVNSGEWVSRGEKIAKSGNTGRTTGPNLHFEVQVNGRPVNPLNYFR